MSTTTGAPDAGKYRSERGDFYRRKKGMQNLTVPAGMSGTVLELQRDTPFLFSRFRLIHPPATPPDKCKNNCI